MSLSIEPPALAIGWTSERKALFLDRLSAHGNARAACRAVGLSAESAYKQRRRDPLFARGWAAAVVLGRDASIQALTERAVEGVEERIYYRGELVGTRRRYDSRLLLAHLARLDKLADEKGAAADAGRFDELIACIAEGDGAELAAPRASYVEQAGDSADDRLRHEHAERHPALYSDESSDPLTPPGYLSDEEEALFQAVDDECFEAAEQARLAAGREWDRYQAAIYEAVDALCAPPDAPVQSGLPGHPLATAATSTNSTPAGAERALLPFDGPASFAPCTPSTASTIALARGLAGPLPSRDTTPRSPFSAPRSIGSRR